MEQVQLTIFVSTPVKLSQTQMFNDVDSAENARARLDVLLGSERYKGQVDFVPSFHYSVSAQGVTRVQRPDKLGVRLTDARVVFDQLWTDAVAAVRNTATTG